MSNEFDIRSRIREVLESTDEADPGVLAELVISELSSEEKSAAIYLAIRTLVREIIRGIRARSSVDMPGQSRKVHALQAWAARLRERYEVDDDGNWKLLRDMTAMNLKFAAEERRAIARANLARADELEKWAGEIAAHGVETFGELPEDVQRRLLAGEANEDVA